jgi:hypothetical protein
MPFGMTQTGLRNPATRIARSSASFSAWRHVAPRRWARSYKALATRFFHAERCTAQGSSMPCALTMRGLRQRRLQHRPASELYIQSP